MTIATGGFMRRCFEIAVLVLGWGTTGCVQAIYYPNIVNAPMLAKEGDLHLAVHGSPIQGQMNVAYAVTNHVAVRAQGDGRISFTGAGEGNSSVDGGVSYFWKAPGEGKSGFRHSIDLDYGIGEVRDVRTEAVLFGDEETDGPVEYEVNRFRTSFQRFSVQGTTGYHTDGYSVAGVMRVSQVSGVLKYDYEDSSTGASDSGEEGIGWLQFEPAVVVRSKLGTRLCLETQLGASIGGPHGPVAETATVWPFILAVGLSADF